MKLPEIIVYMWRKSSYKEVARIPMEANSNPGGIVLGGFKAVGLAVDQHAELFRNVTINGIKGDAEGFHIWLARDDDGASNTGKSLSVAGSC